MMESPAVFSAFQFSLSILVGKEATSQSRAIEGYITIEQHLQLTTHFRNLRSQFDSQEYFYNPEVLFDVNPDRDHKGSFRYSLQRMFIIWHTYTLKLYKLR